MQSPRHLGGIDGEKRIRWSRRGEGQLNREAAAGLIHEMAHVVVWTRLGHAPDLVDESGAMLAIEYEACRRIRADWSTWMSLWSSEDGVWWPRLSPRMRSDFLVAAWLEAERRGLMMNGKPTYRGGPGRRA